MNDNLLSKVKNFLAEHSLLSDEPYLVAFSGGADSMCLLHALNSVSDNKIIAIHLNHNWRGKESDDEEAECRRFCDKLNIDFYSEKLSGNVQKTETAAREARYAFFLKCAKKFNSKVIFTAHNANDNAETVLYRIVKGTGIDGLAGISEVRKPFYRPLLSVSRKDIEAYCSENGLSPNVDSSNFDVKYNRNFLRHKIFPELEKINPQVIKVINSLSELAAEETLIMNKLTSSINTNTAKFIQAEDNLKNRVIKKLLIDNDIDYDRKKLSLITEFIINNSKSKSGKTVSLSDKLNLFVNSEYFKVVSVQKDKIDTSVKIDKEGIYRFDNGILSISKCSSLPETFPTDSENVIYANIDKINFLLRTRLEGDYIKPLGLSGTQKLKKYLNEKKIPKHEKDFIPLLCSGQEVLWVVGVGISDKIKVEDKVTHIIKFEYRRNCDE